MGKEFVCGSAARSQEEKKTKDLHSRRIVELVAGIPLLTPLPKAAGELVSTGLHFDSRRILPGYLFFAFAGANVDGRSFVPQALAHGAVGVVSELPAYAGFEGLWIQVSHARRAMALMARKFFDDLTRRTVRLFGVTGTNGKTTTVYILHSILEAAGYFTGMFGTIEYRLGPTKLPSVNTTPESVDLYEAMAHLAESNISAAPLAVAMEASSHALALGRIWGLHFHGAVWTNLTRDHLDFHGSMEKYRDAKFELFRGQDAPPPAFAAVNADDPIAAQIPVAPSTQAWTYAVHSPALVRAEHLETSFSGTRFDLVSPLGRLPIFTPLLGDINVANILGAAAVTLLSGIPPELVSQGIAQLRSVPGRFERIDAGQPFLVVADYAHTDDALRNVIRVARTLQPKRVITLFGCGGDRDRSKRPLMGAAAAEASDFVILTSDNPRTEDPLAILNDALVGLGRFDTPYLVEVDRAKAIRQAIAMAAPGDLILLAGKGHEDYQIIGQTKHPFDDRLVARQALAAQGYAERTA